jgi:hypothetical protein
MMRDSTKLKPMAVTSANSIIEKYYIKYNFPNQQKLYRIMRDDDIDITHKQIKDYLNEKIEAQLLKINKPMKKREGHIIAITYEDNAQMDIYDLSKYKNYNRGFKYILTVIDVFTRKAFEEPMKTSIKRERGPCNQLRSHPRSSASQQPVGQRMNRKRLAYSTLSPLSSIT